MTCGRSARRSPSRSSPRSSSSSRVQLAAAARGRRRPRPAARGPPSGEARSRELVERALELGLEPLVEAHDERELERALATGARLIGLNNRDLRTLDVDVERAARLRGARPRRPAGHRRVGRPRAGDRRPLARARVRWRTRRRGAGPIGRSRRPRSAPSSRPGPRRTIRPTWRAGRSSRSAASPTPTGSSPRSRPAPTRSDSTSSPARPGRSRCDEAADAGRGWPAPPAAGGRAAGRRDHRRCVAGAPGGDRREPSTPTSSSSAATSRSKPFAAIGRRTWKVLHLPADGAGEPDGASRRTRRARPCVPRRRRRADPPRHGRRAAPGRDRARAPPSGLAAAVARELPVTLAGGLTRPASPGRCASVAGGRGRRRVRRRGTARSPVSVRPRTRSASRSSPSVPGPPATIARTSPSARRPSTPACSRPTAQAAGGWSATSAAATCPRR